MWCKPGGYSCKRDDGASPENNLIRGQSIMEVTIEYLGAVQFEVRARTHTIICDQPLENGGFDEGITPPELMLASLGTCAGYYAAVYLTARQLPTSGMQIRVTAEKAKSPARLGCFRVEVHLPAAIGIGSRP